MSRYRVSLDVTRDVMTATRQIIDACAEAMDSPAGVETFDFIRAEVRQNILSYIRVCLLHPQKLTVTDNVMILDPGRTIWAEVLSVYFDGTGDTDEVDVIPALVRARVSQAVNECLQNVGTGLYQRYGIRLVPGRITDAPNADVPDPRWLVALDGHDSSILVLELQG